MDDAQIINDNTDKRRGVATRMLTDLNNHLRAEVIKLSTEVQELRKDRERLDLLQFLIDPQKQAANNGCTSILLLIVGGQTVREHIDGLRDRSTAV